MQLVQISMEQLIMACLREVQYEQGSAHLLISVLLLIAHMAQAVHEAHVVGKARIMLLGGHISHNEDEVKARQDGSLQVHVLLSRHHVIIPAAHMCTQRRPEPKYRQDALIHKHGYIPQSMHSRQEQACMQRQTNKQTN